MAFDEPEETKLIDVSELQGQMAEDFAQEATLQEQRPDETIPGALAVTPEAPLAAPQLEPGTTRLASFSERFTAWCIDTTVLWYLYWALVQGYHQILEGSWSGPAPTNLEWAGLGFHGVYLLLAIAYYFLSEGLFSTTIGKFFCWMYVRQSDGRIASLTAIVLRTLFRPIDYLLAPITLATIEFTKHNQRIGDVIANTIVIKKQRAHAALSVEWDTLAGWTGRLFSGLLDSALLIGLIVALVMLLSPDRPFISQWLLLAGPGLLLMLIALLHTATQTTPCGWCFGYRLVQENGVPIGFSHAFLRTLFWPIDLLCGPLAVVLSPRRQRIGDMVAGTLVVRERRSAKGFVGLVAIVALLMGIGYAATFTPSPWINRSLQWAAPTTWINPNFRLTFFPRTELFPDFPSVQPNFGKFRIAAFRFAEGTPDNARSPAVYVPGEVAFFVFDVDGFHTKGNMVWIQQDLAIRYPDNTFGLRQENIIDHKQVKRIAGPLVLKNSINLPEGLPTGTYTVFITLRDKFGGGAPIIHNETFFIKDVLGERTPPTLPTAPSPTTAPEPAAEPLSPPTPPSALPAPETIPPATTAPSDIPRSLPAPE